MSARERFVVRGETYLSIDLVARWYEVEVRWLHAVCEEGLLARVEEVEGSTAIAAAELDRLASIVRLHRHHDVNLAGIAWILGVEEAP